MQNTHLLSAIAAVAVFVSGSAYAQVAAYRGEAKLATAASAPRAETISGASWTCDGDACVGAAPRKTTLDAPVRECKKVVAVLGPVTAYKTSGRSLSDGQIRACNKGASEVQTARN